MQTYVFQAISLIDRNTFIYNAITINYINHEKISFISNISEIVNYTKVINHYLNNKNVKIYALQKFEKKIIKEQVILVILSCGRWGKLSQSIESIEKYNTYKYVLAKYVLDDCKDLDGFDNMMNKYGLNTKYNYYFINGIRNPNISLPRTNTFTARGFRSHSVIRLFVKNVYYNNDTLQQAKYLFITENDWIFYEYGFIEDSFSIIYGGETWNHSVQVYTLRNTQMNKEDFVGYPAHRRHDFCGGETYKLHSNKSIYQSSVLGYSDRIVYYWISNDKHDNCWGGYTNNPHLQNIEQLLEKDKNENITLNKYDINTIYGEFEMSCFVKSVGYVQAYPIYNGYVRHIGTSAHTQQRFTGMRQLSEVTRGYNDRCIPIQNLIQIINPLKED